MSLPLDFPLYSNGPKLYNVSLAFPGPKLYDTPVGSFAKKMGYDNTTTSLIFPEIEFIKKFASYDLGISDAILKSAFNSNISKISAISKRDNIDEKSINNQFKEVFESSSQDGMGLKGIEKAILSSIFETQKPYFEVVQSITSVITDIEDVIARICPILGAPLVSPTSVLSIKSRKPISKGSDTGFGPAAIGFGGGSVLKSKIREFKKVSQKGNDISVSRDGVVKIDSPIFERVTETNDQKYDYITISTIYSTGQFNPYSNYTYRYIDIDDVQVFPQIPEDDKDKDYDDIKPEKIIFGIYDTDGNPVDPRSKIEYWNIDQSSGELVKEKSIFEKSPWIYKTKKWIFPKEDLEFGSGEKFSWDLVDSGSETLWVKNNALRIGDKIIILGDLVWSQSNPDVDTYTSVKYGELPGFDKNGPFGFRKDEIVKYVGQEKVDKTIRYYEDFTKSELESSKVDPEDREDVLNLVKEVYKPRNGETSIGGRQIQNEDPVRETIKNITSFGKMKLSLYDKFCEEEDWQNYSSDVNRPYDTNIWGPTNENPQSSNEGGYNPNIRKSYAPMKFNIDGNSVWIDPEIDYDLKIIRVDSTNRISYKETSGLSKSLVRDSYISEFVKNIFQIKVIDSIDGIRKEKKFSYRISKNDQDPSIGSNLLNYNLTNWNFEFNSSENTFSQVNNTFNIEIFLDSENPPTYLIDRIISDSERISLGQSILDNVFNKPRSGYDFIGDSPLRSTWKKIVRYQDPNEETIPNNLTKVGNSYYYTDLIVKYHSDKVISPKNEIIYDDLISQGRVAEANLFTNSVSEIFKWYEVDPTPKSGIFTISPTPPKEFRNLKIEVIDGVVQRWIIFEGDITRDTEFLGKKILPSFFKKNVITFDLTSNESNSDGSSDLDIIEVIDLGKFNAKLSDEGNPIIDSSSILNNDLIKDGLYSKGRYGIGIKDSENGDDPLKFGYVRRSQLTELDVESYYIIEGVKTKNNKTDNRPNSEGSGGPGFYRLPDALGITPVVIRMVVKIGSKIIPNINKLISLIKNPTSFITEIIMMKMGESFSVFSSDAISDLVSIDSISKDVKSENDPIKKKKLITKAKDRLKESKLKNYVFFGDDGNFKFLIDGTGLIGFFGILFGLKLDITNSFNSLPIKPIFERDKKGLDYLIEKFKSDTKYNLPDFIGIEEDKIPSNIVTNGGGKYGVPFKDPSYETISIVYSTGEYVEGIDYKYIYIDQKISNLLEEGDRIANESLEDVDLALEKYNEAYNMSEKSDVPNLPLKKEIIEKIKALKEKSNVLTQPIIKFLLGVVTLPIKIIFEVVKWLIDFFKSLTNPTKIPDKMKEFLSFKWIIEFFTPKFIFEMAGIKFNPDKISEWVQKSRIKNPLFGEYGQPEYTFDDFPLADLNQFFSIPFEGKLPTYTGKQFRETFSQGLRISIPFFCLFERIINGFIMLIWSIMGITAIIPPPLIKICNKLNENIDIEDLQSILSGMYSAKDNDGAYGYTTSDEQHPLSFVYDIKMPDGSIRKDLNREEILKIIEENKDFDFDFSNFETL